MGFKEEVAMQLHPRAFSAFGADLVTNDCVAIAELVKNCYDAFANHAIITINSDSESPYIVIEDDGVGMTRDIIKNAWAVIATPYKEIHPYAEKDGRIRRVSGNKGLGRFSAARLGRYIDIRTKSNNGECISAYIDWESFSQSGNISDCKVLISEIAATEITTETGTIIRIGGLTTSWDDKKINELENALSRLISPFDEISDFSITLYSDLYSGPVEIRPQEFINSPTYSIEGKIDMDGNILWDYKYRKRKKVITENSGTIEWKDARYGFDQIPLLETEGDDNYTAGPFSFEIRAWDLDSDSVADISDTFNIKKRDIRNNISQYKGLSVYRDGVLVLPKSDSSKDWLGLDIRRVSQIGKRISTSQIIGLLKISSEDNPEIKDTTDREKLVDTKEYKQFCKISETIILTLENLRFSDKQTNTVKTKKKVITDLITPLDSSRLVGEVEAAVERGYNSEQILDVLRDYSAANEKNLLELNERLTYYAQTASLGSVAVVILHEILNGTTSIKRFIDRVKEIFPRLDNRTNKYLEDANIAHARLIEVAGSFAPLYNKRLHSQTNKSNISHELNKSIRLMKGKKDAKKVLFNNNVESSLWTSVHPGELQTIFINLLDNACYWMKHTDTKEIYINSDVQKENKVLITVSDTGVGINSGDEEKIFQPGITRKPTGIGMGLVIVTELLNNYDCKVGTTIPGLYGGATFVFELPKIKGV